MYIFNSSDICSEIVIHFDTDDLINFSQLSRTHHVLMNSHGILSKLKSHYNLIHPTSFYELILDMDEIYLSFRSIRYQPYHKSSSMIIQSGNLGHLRFLLDKYHLNDEHIRTLTEDAANANNLDIYSYLIDNYPVNNYFVYLRGMEMAARLNLHDLIKKLKDKASNVHLRSYYDIILRKEDIHNTLCNVYQILGEKGYSKIRYLPYYILGAIRGNFQLKEEWLNKINQPIYHHMYFQYAEAAYQNSNKSLYQYFLNLAVTHQSLTYYRDLQNYCNCLKTVVKSGNFRDVEHLLSLVNNFDCQTDVVTVLLRNDHYELLPLFYENLSVQHTLTKHNTLRMFESALNSQKCLEYLIKYYTDKYDNIYNLIVETAAKMGNCRALAEYLPLSNELEKAFVKSAKYGHYPIIRLLLPYLPDNNREITLSLAMCKAYINYRFTTMYVLEGIINEDR